MTSDTVGADWNDTLRSLEAALATGDAAQVASIAIAVTLGPLPDRLGDRAANVLHGIARLEDEITRQMASIAHDLDRIPSRSRWGAPPAPSQLDCSA